ncbi:MAG: hypothetical protein BM557_04675 [Flavobacterium sp. MedPE-SWcel]|uniref:DUF2851 family protein n=1 Tax=uncultured Flavobacterium sp. TaxID=165435 RepID=UPI00091CF7BF|nr:DUF2851 family protein [uncultured Flavobacterium sp.]OIQ21054.1 MAG: hypothetical protein BM557_04675 [Flavobacterium sp. MedPE-SWcel]
MKEDFLHHIWQYKKLDVQKLRTVQGENISILNSGQYLQQSGPDFFNAKVIIGSQTWAGNVEIHVKSSDWYLHSHERDAAYDNVILHVVWEHDAEVMRDDNTEIPVLELKNYADTQVFNSYNKLTSDKTWIYCEKELQSFDSFVLENWKERLFFERLERKALPILNLAKETNNDWEAVLFCFLAKNFGLNTNGTTFYALAKSLPFSIVRKESFEVENLEALFFGKAKLLLEKYEDVYVKDLASRYEYITNKHRLEEVYIDRIEFFRHRPDNFPTIRLSQLAQLYHTHQNLFSKIIEANTVKDIYDIFKVSVSTYWQTHYNFDKESTKKRKALTPSFIDLVIINTIVPFRFAYAKSLGKETSEDLLELLQQLSPEKNSIIEKFKHFKVPVTSAYDTQALLQLKNEYCNHKKCMQCGIGLELLKN